MSSADTKSRPPSPPSSPSSSARLAWLGVVTAVAVNLFALVGYAVKTGEAVGALTETSSRHTEDIRDLRETDRRTAERLEQQFKSLSEISADLRVIRMAIERDHRYAPPESAR